MSPPGTAQRGRAGVADVLDAAAGSVVAAVLVAVAVAVAEGVDEGVGDRCPAAVREPAEVSPGAGMRGVALELARAVVGAGTARNIRTGARAGTRTGPTTPPAGLVVAADACEIG